MTLPFLTSSLQPRPVYVKSTGKCAVCADPSFERPIERVQ